MGDRDYRHPPEIRWRQTPPTSPLSETRTRMAFPHPMAVPAPVHLRYAGGGMPRPIVALRSRSRVTTGVGDVTGERAGRKCADHTCLPRRKDDPRRVARSPPNL